MMAWKGWLGVATHYSQHGGSPHRRVYVDNPVGDPVIVTPIEDESLPHPGDGRIWETRAKSKVVDVVATDGDFVWVRYGAKYRGFLCRPSDLRERKPAPDHKPWCDHYVAMSYAGCTDVCTCERRSGEDRRKKKSKPVRALGVTYYVRDGDLGTLHVGTRVGVDRRSS